MRETVLSGNVPTSGATGSPVLHRFAPILAVIVVCWVVAALNLVWGGQLSNHGIVPRHLGSLPSILWAPFIHASIAHVAANTVPLLILGAIISARGVGEFWEVMTGGVILGGGLTWLFGRAASHVGASGLIFCFFGYLASLAFFKRSIGTFLVSLLCMVGYGGMLVGILPRAGPVSWEGHLAGLIAGVLLAWLLSRSGSRAAGGARMPDSLANESAKPR